jgi:hypothetical protein
MILAMMLAAVLQAAPGAERALPLGSGWELQGDAAVASAGGREELRVGSGQALRRDVSLQDGTIDFDVQLTGRRSFVYLYFRVRDDNEREEVYLRPHKSGLGDALQYAPVWQGQGAWQLYHGPGGTAPVEFDRAAPVHVRLVLSGRRAALFVGDMARPALLIPALARTPEPGAIALRGFLPAGVPGEGPVARFSNVTVRPDVAYDFGPPPPAPAVEPGSVRAWMVSPAFPPSAFEAEPVLPAAGAAPWMRLEAEPGGLVALHRSVPLPKGSRAGAAAARVWVRAPSAGVRAFDLGFSDTATVFLNGVPLFRGQAAYSYDAPRREGLIGYDQARLYLPLVAGDNELVVVVGDSFGGWGIMGRFADARGLAVEAR